MKSNRGNVVPNPGPAGASPTIGQRPIAAKALRARDHGVRGVQLRTALIVGSLACGLLGASAAWAYTDNYDAGGGGAYADKATAVGYNARAYDEYGTALGAINTSSGYATSAIGAGNLVGGDRSTGTGAGNAVGAIEGSAFGSRNGVVGDYGTALGANNRVRGIQGTAVGSSNESSGEAAIALGAQNSAPGFQSTALGFANEAIGNQSIAVGVGNRVEGNNSGAFGDPNLVSGNGSYAFGNNNTIAQDNTFVLGNSVTTTQANSVVLGHGSADRAAVPVSGVVINGNAYKFAGSAPQGVVSVGAAGAERQIINVGAGQLSATSTDAVNGSQLYATNQAVDHLTDHVTVTKDAVAGVSAQMATEIPRLDSRIDQVDNRASAGSAAAIAAAGLPQASRPGEKMVSIASGVWRGETGYALGISAATPGGSWVIKGAVIGSSRGD